MRPYHPLFVITAALLALPSLSVEAQLPAQSGAPVPALPTNAAIAARQVQIGDSVRIPLIVNDLPVGTVVDFRLDRLPATAKLVNGVLDRLGLSER